MTGDAGVGSSAGWPLVSMALPRALTEELRIVARAHGRSARQEARIVLEAYVAHELPKVKDQR